MNANDRLIEARRRALWREVAMTRQRTDRRDNIRYWVAFALLGIIAAAIAVFGTYIAVKLP